MKIFKPIANLARRFVDSDRGSNESRGELPDQFEFGRLIPILILHLGCFAVIWVGFSWFALSVAVGLYLVRMFAVTGFLHRYFSHRSFRTSRSVQFIFAVIANSAMQRGPLWWAAIHRHHHNHSDEEPDAHSPRKKGILWSHIGWLTSPKNTETDYSKVKDLAAFPELVFLNRCHSLVPLIFGVLLWIFGSVISSSYPALETSAAQVFVWGFFISTTVLLHGTLLVNSMAHTVGSQRFDNGDDSKNSGVLALITLGEGWHNNHHRYPHSTRQGFYWFEIDITYYILKLMEAMRIISDLRRVPDHIYEEAKQEGSA